MSAAAASAGARRSGLFLFPTVTLWQREIVRFYRQRNRIIGALLTPLVFWFLIGSGIGPSFRAGSSPNGVGYLEYFYPGTLILIMLFTAIFSTISIIEDRREGFLQSVLVAPISPGSIVCGKILGGTTLALMQGFDFSFARAICRHSHHARAAPGLSRHPLRCRLWPDRSRLSRRLADGIDPGLSRHHECLPHSALAHVRRAFPRDQSALLDLLAVHSTRHLRRRGRQARALRGDPGSPTCRASHFPSGSRLALASIMYVSPASS